MLKTYDTSQRAFTEHTPKIYFTGVAAWGDAPSAKTYDTAQAAWIERLYQYFTLSSSSFDNGGKYEPNNTGVGITVGVVTDGFNDSCVMKWSGNEIINPVLTCNYSQSGTPESAAHIVNPTVYFKYQGNTVYSRKLYPETVNGFFSGVAEMSYTGAIDEILIICTPTLTGITNPFYLGITNLEINGKKFRFK